MISTREKKEFKKEFKQLQKRLDKALKGLDKLEYLVNRAGTSAYIAAEDMDDFARELLDTLKGGG
jgi:hypothetical protein